MSDNQSEHVSRKQQFLLASLESKIDHSDELQAERLSHIKDQVLEKLKTNKQRRNNSKRRYSCIGIEDRGSLPQLLICSNGVFFNNMNIHGQTGLDESKQVQIEQFIKSYNKYRYSELSRDKHFR